MVNKTDDWGFQYAGAIKLARLNEQSASRRADARRAARWYWMQAKMIEDAVASVARALMSEKENRTMAITILALAEYRGLKRDADGASTMADFEAVGLAIFGGCVHCGASIAAYNAYPSRSGYWACADCIGDGGYATAADADRAIFPPEPKPGEHVEPEVRLHG